MTLDLASSLVFTEAEEVQVTEEFTDIKKLFYLLDIQELAFLS